MKQLLSAAFLFFSLSSVAQSGSEIILFDMKVANGHVVLSNPVNITNHKGYDNQPFFHPSKPIIYYSSFNDSGRSDIKYYNLKKNETTNLTITNEREYSPTVTPDGEFISCIIQRDNGAQDLGKYPVTGGVPEVLIKNLKVGYHAWAAKDKLLLFVLGDSANTLHYYSLPDSRDTVLAANIGRSLHRIPGQNEMSFVQNISEKKSLIKKIDLATMNITPITLALPGQDHFTWLKNNILLMSDGVKLFWYDTNTTNGWVHVIIKGEISMLRGVTRLAANAGNTKLAVVVSE